MTFEIIVKQNDKIIINKTTTIMTQKEGVVFMLECITELLSK